MRDRHLAGLLRWDDGEHVGVGDDLAQVVAVVGFVGDVPWPSHRSRFLGSLSQHRRILSRPSSIRLSAGNANRGKRINAERPHLQELRPADHRLPDGNLRG